MKKIIFFCAALMLGLSSCGFFAFEPVPAPVDWTYAVVKTSEKGDVLTAPLKLPHSTMSTSVYVESTLNNWTLKDQPITVAPGGPIPAGMMKFTGNADHPNGLTISNPAGDKVLTVTWPTRAIEIWKDAYSFEMPLFSGPITITKTDDFLANHYDTYTAKFTVKAYAWFDFGIIPVPTYPTFEIEFQAPTTAEKKAYADELGKKLIDIFDTTANVGSSRKFPYSGYSTEIQALADKLGVTDIWWRILGSTATDVADEAEFMSVLEEGVKWGPTCTTISLELEIKLVYDGTIYKYQYEI